VKSPRHCYNVNQVHALIGKRYKCKLREKAKELRFGFRGYNKDVIDKSNDYQNALEKDWVCDISHLGAISLNLLEKYCSQTCYRHYPLVAFGKIFSNAQSNITFN
jgi:hypothetical protein